MKKEINQHIAQLRAVMQQSGVVAFIVPGTDPHASEYIADYWKEREWISGFDGSAGTIVITADKAGLWTDSRYFLQATEQLDGTGITLMKQGTPDTLEIDEWLCTTLNKGDKVAVNPQMFSANSFQQLGETLSMHDIELVSNDLLHFVWTQRPALPLTPLFIFENKYAGQTVENKLKALRLEMKKAYANVCVLSALDDIAWLFNIRGNDVNYNPVVIAYALVDETTATLFVDSRKVSPDARIYFEENGIRLSEYGQINRALSAIPETQSVLIDGTKLNQELYKAIPTDCTKRNQMSPVFRLKSIKNEVEVEGIRNAMIKDGVALTKFFKWLETTKGKEKITELSATRKLQSFRAEQDLYKGDSFGTIAGYKGHGAIVHYSANETSDATMSPEGMFLIDSGGQYLDGTTDITRTVHLGTPNEEEITDYTLVLQGHIRLGMAQFIEGTRGSQLDILARKALWDRGLNYGHGTGHGVGHFLNVHEGPQNIRMDENPITLQQGMILSNEPGMYRTDKHGIRIENLVHVIPATKTEFGQFLKFETLTLCYIDTNLINHKLLSNRELEWFNNYQQRVFDTLSPFLDTHEKEWLAEKCKSI